MSSTFICEKAKIGRSRNNIVIVLILINIKMFEINIAIVRGMN